MLPYSYRGEEIKSLSPKLQTEIFPLHKANLAHMLATEPISITRKMLYTDWFKPQYPNHWQEGWAKCDWRRPEVSKHGEPNPAHPLLLYSFITATLFLYLLSMATFTLLHGNSRAQWLLTETTGPIHPQIFTTTWSFTEKVCQPLAWVNMGPLWSWFQPPKSWHNERKLDPVGSG